MHLLTYPDQLRMLANENNTTIQAACRKARIPYSTLHRSIRDGQNLRLPTAEKIAHAIIELGKEETVPATHGTDRRGLASANH